MGSDLSSGTASLGTSEAVQETVDKSVKYFILIYEDSFVLKTIPMFVKLRRKTVELNENKMTSNFDIKLNGAKKGNDETLDSSYELFLF